MIKIKEVGIFLVYLFLWLPSEAQVNRYMVFFTDKNDNGYSVAAPEQFLTERAIERRIKGGIAITDEDMPVTPTYLTGLQNMGADVYFTSRWVNAALVQMDSNLVNQIKHLPFVAQVEYVSKNARLTRTREQFELPSTFLESNFIAANPSLQVNMLGANKMHEDGFTGEGIMIAVLDGGFTGTHLYQPMSHIFTSGKLVAAHDFVTDSYHPFRFSSHGTSVLSCIAARSGNFIGTAPDASFIILVTEDVSSESRIEEYNWLIAAEYADSLGADIIHSSLGYYDFNESFMNYSYANLDGNTAVSTLAAQKAAARGMLVVTSAGNEGNTRWRYITAPADASNALAIGAIDQQFRRSSFSSFGPTADGRIKPDLMALGTSTTVMNGTGAIVTGNGTSYAAPLVAGLAAGLWQKFPELDNQQLMSRLKATASRALTPDTIFGFGVPNYTSFVEGSILAVRDVLSDQVKVYPNPFRDNKLYVDISGISHVMPITIQLYNGNGQLIGSWKIENMSQQVIELQVNPTEKGLYLMDIQSALFNRQVKLLHK